MGHTLNRLPRTSFLAVFLAPLVLAQTGQAFAAARAFPEAEGFGALATGGRGNKVVHVTNLLDAGAGSLRDAISQGNRIVVFDVGGVISITSKLVAAGDNLTIAGQTAPGDGITIYGDGTSFSSRKNIVVRFVRFHQGLAQGSAEGTKAVNLTDVQNMIFDHVSIQWGRWDGFGVTGDSSTVTLQDSIVGEGIVPQKFGSIIDSVDQITVARNLWIDNESRNPKFKANGQYINNVVYNWGDGGGLIGGHSSADWYEDVINNYLIAGPANAGGFLSQYASTDRVFHQGNLVDLNLDGILNGRAVADADFKGDSPPTFETAAHNKPAVAVTVLTPQAAYDRILAQAGVCSKRDTVDLRLVTQARSLGKSGAILAGTDGEAAVGGQPSSTQSQRPAGFDGDGDGIPDTWETAHGLDPTNAADATSDSTGDGYSNVEKYLNELASSACGAAPVPADAGTGVVADAAGNADASHPGATEVGSPDAGVKPDLADASTLPSDAATGASKDAFNTADTLPPSPDNATGRDSTATSPDAAAVSDLATVFVDTQPALADAGVSAPDAATSSPDVGRDSTAGAQARDASAIPKAQATGCTCSMHAGYRPSGWPWLLLGLAWLVRRFRTTRPSGKD